MVVNADALPEVRDLSEMLNKPLIKNLLIGGLVLLISSVSIARGERAVSGPFTMAQASTVDDADAARKTKFDCLPKGTRLEDVVSHRRGGKNLTVADKLAEIKAQCRNGKLVDSRRREIRFFHISCWGNPPPDYREIQQREGEELTKLKARYTVITFGCNPLMP